MSAFLSQPIFSVLFFLAFVVLVHEAGHFLVGKLFGIGVETFSIGFGPKVLGFVRNGTEYRVGALPLGGYVKFAGATHYEPVPQRFEKKRMCDASIFGRFCTILAGPMANLALAVVIHGIHGFHGIEHPAAIIGTVLPGPADSAGLLPGDRLISVKKQGDERVPIKSWTDMQKVISGSPGVPLEFQVERQGNENYIKIQLVPDSIVPDGLHGKDVKGQIGVGLGMVPAVASIDPYYLERTGESNPALVAGIQTGDKVVKVSYQSEDGTTSTFEVKSWANFLIALKNAYNQQAAQLELTVASIDSSSFTSDPKDGKDSLYWQKTREVRVETIWQTQSVEYNGKASQLENLARSIGLTHSQTTVAHLKLPADQILQTKDQILEIDGKKVENIFDVRNCLQGLKKDTIEVIVQRNLKRLTLQVPLKERVDQRPEGRTISYALTASFLGEVLKPEIVLERYQNVVSALMYGVKTTALYTTKIASGIGGLISGQLPLKSLGGPILIASVAGNAAEAGLMPFFIMMALVSINLGVFNLFPIPALDGGQLVLVAVEGFRRRPLSEAGLENFQRIGFIMMLSLIVLATYNDLSRFWSNLLKSG